MSSPSDSTDDTGGEVPTVLVVEDEPGLAQLYTIWLEEYYDVRTAYGPTEALEELDESVDVILLDRRMPGRSGDELLTLVRDLGYDVQVMMVSGIEPDVEIADMAIDEYLTKPVDRTRIEAAVDELLLRSEEGTTEQEFLSLLSRKMALEERHSGEELAGRPEFERLERRVDRLAARTDLAVHRISSKFRPGSCPECGLRWDVTVNESVGFISLGSYVWKCNQCGEVVHYTDPFDRRVARR